MPVNRRGRRHSAAGTTRRRNSAAAENDAAQPDTAPTPAAARGSTPRQRRPRRPNVLPSYNRRYVSQSSPPRQITPPDEYRPFFRLLDPQTVRDLRAPSHYLTLLLLTPTLAYSAPRPDPTLLYGDPFIPLGIAIHENHPIVRHIPYDQSRGFGPEHVAMLSDVAVAKVVVVVADDFNFTLDVPDTMTYLAENTDGVADDFNNQLQFARDVHQHWAYGGMPLRPDTGRMKPLVLITMGEWNGLLAGGYGVEQFHCVAHMMYRQEDFLEMAELLFDRAFDDAAGNEVVPRLVAPVPPQPRYQSDD